MKQPLLISLMLVSVLCHAQSVMFQGVQEVKPLKRGKSYSIRWSGGEAHQTIGIELKGNKGIAQSWSNVLNDGEEVLRLRGNLRPGVYHFEFITPSGDVVTSSSCRIKRRVPLGAKVFTAAALPLLFILVNPDADHGRLAEPIGPQ